MLTKQNTEKRPSGLPSLPTPSFFQHFFSWFMQKGFLQGAFWAIMINFVSVSNDVIMRLLGQNLDPIQIVFFRFLFGALTVVPLMLPHGTALFKTKRPALHVLRAIFGAAAIGCCCIAVNKMPLSDNTAIMFSQPLFFLPMAILFLRERVGLSLWLGTMIGFLGLIIIIQPGTDAFRLVALFPIASALLFASLDVMAKKMVSTENTHSMLFYFAFGTTLATALPAFWFWKNPSLTELALLVLLGIGGNLIQFCIIRAFSATDASALMPFRYVEFLFSSLFGFLFFREIPLDTTLYGALFIIAGTAYNSYIETQKERKT